jgi:hypothetical protein
MNCYFGSNFNRECTDCWAKNACVIYQYVKRMKEKEASP